MKELKVKIVSQLNNESTPKTDIFHKMSCFG